ncbi:MAG: hypothetical protein A2Y38_06970 [Spirochaetes bacterium GWB1_59_5]|nr:MAG: hypothetical protein A2Y38_06970 [Spirochaetes bacterium GWB1_59_5]
MPLPDLDIFEKLRGIFTPVTDIRRKVLIEVAKMVTQGKETDYVETLPYTIIRKNTPTYRESVFRERAVVRERVRLALGLDLKEFGAHAPIIDDAGPALVSNKVIAEPLINIIKIGCQQCPEKSYFVSDCCMGCMAHPCVPVCPKSAVAMIGGKSFIDQGLCIKCGRCMQVCPYGAILYRERPCASACGVGAIRSDAEGFADIDYEVCVSCGLCIVSCPFGAIGEKSEIVQVLLSIKKGDRVYAELAPSFVGQFGPLVKPENIKKALSLIGFTGIAEVANGADLAIIDESRKLQSLVADISIDGGCAFVGTSCCPSWVLAARRAHPDMARYISDSYTPMVETARRIKEADEGARVVFIGPCVSKKMECFNPLVSEFVDFVITFEELAALFLAKNVDPSGVSEEESIGTASAAGRSYPVAGNVIQAILGQYRKNVNSSADIPHASADTLKDCLDLLNKIEKKRIVPQPLLVAGMACPHGCIGGPGTLAPLNRAKAEVEAFAKKAPFQLPIVE